MTEWTRIGRGFLGLSVVLTAILLGASSTALAVTYLPIPPVKYEPEPKPEPGPPPFCTPAPVRDYLEPLGRLPKRHTPAASGQLGFGPASLRLSPLPALVAGEGRVGYKLHLEGQARVLHPNWTVTTTLSRLDRKGRVAKVLDRVQRRVRTIRPGRGAGVQFEIKGVSAPYLVTAVFRAKSGRKLGRYGFYFRLVPATSSVGLSLNANSFRAGDTVFGRIENFGTLWASYGAQYTIERLKGTAWEKSPESPEAFALPVYSAEPGKSGAGCSIFKTRPWTPPGRYRMSKEVFIETVPRSRVDPVTVYAEFDVRH